MSFLTISSMCLACPSLHWAPAARVPHLHRYYGSLRLLDLRPASLRSPSFSGTSVRRLSMQAEERRVLACAKFCRFAIQLLSVERSRPPRFLGNPRVHAMLYDPGEARDTRASGCAEGAFRCNNDVGPHGCNVLGAGLHGLPTGCLRFAAWVTPMPRKTRFRLAALPWPGGFCPRGIPIEVSVFHHSLPPGFAWRNVAH